MTATGQHLLRRNALLEAMSAFADDSEHFSTGTLEKLAEAVAAVLKAQADGEVHEEGGTDANAEGRAYYSLMLALHGPGPWS